MARIRVASRTCSVQPEYVEELHFRSVFYTFCTGTDRRNDGQGGRSGRRDVISPIPRGGLLGERPVVPGVRGRTEREEPSQRQVEGDTAQGPVVGPAWTNIISIWQPDTPRIENGVHSALLAKGKSEAHRRMEASRDQVHPEFHLDYAFMGRETEDRASPIPVGKFSKDRWLITHPVPCKGTQHRWIIGKLVNDVT